MEFCLVRLLLRWVNVMASCLHASCILAHGENASVHFVYCNTSPTSIGQYLVLTPSASSSRIRNSHHGTLFIAKIKWENIVPLSDSPLLHTHASLNRSASWYPYIRHKLQSSLTLKPCVGKWKKMTTPHRLERALKQEYAYPPDIGAMNTPPVPHGPGHLSPQNSIHRSNIQL